MSTKGGKKAKLYPAYLIIQMALEKIIKALYGLYINYLCSWQDDQQRRHINYYSVFPL